MGKIELYYPFPENLTLREEQTFLEHVQVASQKGWCTKPGPCSSKYYYPGIDWSYPGGCQILAAHDAKISKIGFQDGGYGNYVQQQWQEDGYTWTIVYAHLKTIEVKIGQMLEVGQVIGWMGTTGFSTGVHVHFELRRNGIPVDPAEFFVSTTTSILPVVDETIIQVPLFIPAFPESQVTARVISDYINIREEPKADANYLGQILNGETFVVLSVQMIDGDIWAKTGHKQYIVLRYQGKNYVEFG